MAIPWMTANYNGRLVQLYSCLPINLTMVIAYRPFVPSGAFYKLLNERLEVIGQFDNGTFAILISVGDPPIYRSYISRRIAETKYISAGVHRKRYQITREEVPAFSYKDIEGVFE